MQQFQLLEQVVTTVAYNIPNECIWKNLWKTQKTISAATPPHIKQPKKLIPLPKPSPPPKKEKSKKKEEKEEKQQKLETAAYLTETFHPIPLEPKGQSQEEFIPASILVERETTEEMTPIAQLVYALEHCDDQHGGYCIEDGSRGCCVHGPPLCCKDGHGDCIPRLGFNYNNTKCEKLECREGEVCMPLGGEGKDKCVPKKYKENCNALRTFAFDSHTPCYLKCNFTKFNVWFKNADVFAKVIDLKDLFSSETFRQMKNIILGEIMDEKTFEECAFYYNSLDEAKKDLNLAERCSHVLEKKFNQITV
uniref:Uncharacterized protein n=1 Tax=Meloidogyne javanica TaxID=6303 RepID=A0A915MEP9_MELJA